MKIIRGKKAYWGRHTFEATEDTIDGKTVTKINVYRNCPRKFEGTYFFNTKKQLIELSLDENSGFRFYSGVLIGNRFNRIEGKMITEKTIDLFLNNFKHKLG